MSYSSARYGIDPEEDDMLYGQSQTYNGQDALGSSDMASSLDSNPGGDAGAGGGDTSGLVSAGMSGAAAGGPYGAAIAVGGKYLSNYLAQKAQDERAYRVRAAKNAQTYGKTQNESLQNMGSYWRSALR